MLFILFLFFFIFYYCVCKKSIVATNAWIRYDRSEKNLVLLEIECQAKLEQLSPGCIGLLPISVLKALNIMFIIVVVFLSVCMPMLHAPLHVVATNLCIYSRSVGGGIPIV